MSDGQPSPDDPDPNPFNPEPYRPHNVDTAAAQSGSASPPQTSPDTIALREKKARVRFNSNAEARRPQNQAPESSSSSEQKHVSPERPIPKPRPSVLRTSSGNIITTADSHDPDPQSDKALSAAAAQARALRLREENQHGTVTPEERASMESSRTDTTATTSEAGELLPSDIPLQSLDENGQQTQSLSYGEFHERANDLVRSYTQRFGKAPLEQGESSTHAENPKEEEQHAAPAELNDGCWDGIYGVERPENFRGGVLSQLLKLYNKPAESSASSSRPMSSNFGSTTTLNEEHDDLSNAERGRSGNRGKTAGRSRSETPNTRRKKWYEQNKSQETLATLIGASASLANPATPKMTPGQDNVASPKRGKKHKRTSSAGRLAALWQKEEVRITNNIADVLCRQEYIVKLCRALMISGAPTHRLEEFCSSSADALGIEGSFLYVPGCMIISFDDSTTHTTEVKLVRSAQDINLGKLKEVHHIYKEVIHECISPEEARDELDNIIKRKDKFHPWFRVFIFGLTSLTVSPFSFKARYIDLGILCLFGWLVGFLQIIVSPRSKLYSNVFEVSAVVVVSFAARAFGSLNDGNLFCFSALVQGGIAMLLPGYMVLCSSLELQSRQLVPGSIRIVYAIIYSLLLGFGITVGASIYGLIDENATSEQTCRNPPDPYVAFWSVPPFVICICILYQAKWKQMTPMVIIAFAGYVVNFFSGRRFEASPAIANTLGAFTVGVLANFWSRLSHGVAAATLIPAIFTQVPGGLAANGGLISGISTANMISGSNGTDTGHVDQQQLNATVFSVAASMIQIAIGIAVGLFLSALIVYPLGKRRSGLFSF